MEEPNCHTDKRISIQMAVDTLPSQAVVQLMPKVCRRTLKVPSMANMRFHRMATATDPPMMEGR